MAFITNPTVKHEDRIPKGFILVVDFVKWHNLSTTWKKHHMDSHPDAFRIVDNEYYLDPTKLWYADHELNLHYNSRMCYIIDNIGKDLYYTVLHYHEYPLRIAKMLNKIVGRSTANWTDYMTKFEFKPTERTLDFVRGMKVILNQTETWLIANDRSDEILTDRLYKLSSRDLKLN